MKRGEALQQRFRELSPDELHALVLRLPENVNPAIALALSYRAGGAKHSDMDWPELRRAFDYANERQ